MPTNGNVPYCQQFLATLNNQRNFGYYCDVTLHCGESNFKAHRCVVSSCSNRLQIMLANMPSGIENVIPIEDVSESSLKQLLDYMYTGSLRIDASNVLDLYKAAEKLEVKDALKLCAEFNKNNGDGSLTLDESMMNGPNEDDYLKLYESMHNDDSMNTKLGISRNEVSTQTDDFNGAGVLIVDSAGKYY